MKSMLHLTLLLFTLCALSACGDDGKSSPPKPPPVGTLCVTPLDQFDAPLDGCYFNYEPSEEALEVLSEASEETGGGEAPACAEGDLFMAEVVQDEPHRVFATCGALAGYLWVDINEGANDPWATRLEWSFCYDDQPLVASPEYPEIYLDEILGYSTQTRCAHWIFDDNDAELNIEVAELSIDCTDMGEGCEDLEVRDYIRVSGVKLQATHGHPRHLVLEYQEHSLEPGEELQVLVRLQEHNHFQQEVTLPVTVKNP